MLVLKPKKKKRNNIFSETSFVVPHKSLRRFCPCIVAMQAVSGHRKDCDSLFLPNEVPCVNVVYIGRYFVHGIFRVLQSLHTLYALKWTQKYFDKQVLLWFLNIRRVNVPVVLFLFLPVCLCHFLDVTLFLSAYIIRRNSYFVLGKGVRLQLWTLSPTWNDSGSLCLIVLIWNLR